ncbi:uncharacterized protein LOC135388242 [Ornithodoros turicata]|uniref:uncharacterized protein LOC135388242 n=1 Tax=Ornithodoros turicata TaxID=34597 RepID=UPI003138BBBD
MSSTWIPQWSCFRLQEIILPFCLLQLAGARTCTRYVEGDFVGSNGTGPRRYHYHCPGIYHPEEYTECCGPEQPTMCCPADKWFYEIDNTVATIIAVSVTVTCFVLTLVVIICCFWARCPLYSACRSQYSHDIPNHKSEDFVMETVPTESPGNKKSFAPLASTNGTPTSDGVAAV